MAHEINFHDVKPVGEFLSPGDWRIPREIYLTQVCAQTATDFAGLNIPDGLEEINRAAILLGWQLKAESYHSMVRKGHDLQLLGLGEILHRQPDKGTS